MNLYFVVEGEVTESTIYPKWMTSLLPKFGRINFFQDAKEYNYYLFSGGGIPSIYNHTVNAIKDINSHPVYSYLIVCLDGEEIGPNERKRELLDYINNYKVVLNHDCRLEIVIQNVCIETWFLGNRKIFKDNAQGELLRKYMNYYNVHNNDPEIMDKFEFSVKAGFHYSYLREIFKEHGLSYRKTKPKEVLELTYFQQMVKRVEETNHIPTFSEFLNLMGKIQAKS